MKEELATSEEDTQEKLKSKYRYLFKQFNIIKEKLDEELHSNICQSSNVTTMKSMVDRDEVDKRRNTRNNVKLIKKWSYKKKKRNTRITCKEEKGREINLKFK